VTEQEFIHRQQAIEEGKRLELEGCAAEHKAEAEEMTVSKEQELREKIQEALGQLTKQIVDWERKDLPDFNRSVEIFSELQTTLLEVLSIVAERCVFKGKVEIPMTGVEADMWQKGWRPVKEITK